MFIKNIIISGFRSYREQSFPDGLSEHLNIIVGKNGSGKSNFFAAVQFILSEKFLNLTVGQRKELFHVGSGRPSLSIFVEIVFDNSDGRLVIPGRPEELEVRIRRTIGLKQDEFRINDRRFSANEVRQLLESSGFSSSNPYYIVEQGKITHLASMTDEERYRIIKDIAGTQVYESRRNESKRILEETKLKQEQVKESMLEVEQKLSELEQETAELKDFHDAEQEKKRIEYCIFNMELENSKEELLKLEAEWSSKKAIISKSRESETLQEQEIQACETQLAEINRYNARLENEKQSIENQISVLSDKEAVVELDVSDETDTLRRINKEYTALISEKDELQSAIEKAKKNALEKRQIFEKTEALSVAKLSEVAKMQHLVDRLQERRNRGKLFRNQVDRDQWIEKERVQNEQIIQNLRNDLHGLEKELRFVDETIKDEKKVVKDTMCVTQSIDKDLTTRTEKISEAIKTRNELNQRRRLLWEVIHEQEDAVKELGETLKSTRRQMERNIPLDIREGLQSLQEILKHLDPEARKAVHGSLIDLITVQDGFETAVEITAGNSLFNIIVDTFDVGAMLLEKMNRDRKPGRICFSPLDTCRGVYKDIPETPECSPLISKILYDKRFSSVALDVFGRTAVTASLESALKISKDLNCNVVTLDGDQFRKKGSITGGFIDRRNMRLPVYRKEKSLILEVTEGQKKLDQLCQEVASVEQSITEALNELELLRMENASSEKKADEELREARQKEEYILRLSSQKEALLHSKRTLEKSIQESLEMNDRLLQESKEEFKTIWTQEDESKLEKISEELASMKIESASFQKQALDSATEAQLIEDRIEHMERRKAMTSDRIREIERTKRTTNDLDHECDSLKRELALLNDRLGTIKKLIDATIDRKQEIQKRIETLTINRHSTELSLQQKEDLIYQIEAQRTLVIQKRDDALNKIQKLGLPPKGLEIYANFSLGKLMHKLKSANESLKKNHHVNRKAMDQHSSLLQIRNDLSMQQDSLDQELKSIHNLINHLDMKKDEAIERTYKQIQYEFEKVFGELVGSDDAYAQLQLVRSNSNKDVDPYYAARIRVSFGMGSVVSDLAQLSGGQKSLVALTLIFAIQRCDPAPFYLFDEIDAALDAEYRTSVAKMIQKQSEECQFIVTTFKMELLSNADKILGIFFHNKVSRIQTISLDEGIKILKQVAFDDRKRGREEESLI